MTEDDEIAALLRDSAAGWLEARGDAGRLRGDPTAVRPVDDECWREMAGMGWLGLMLPEALGGSGLGLPEACVLAEQFGRRLLAEPFVATAVIPARIVVACQGEAQAALASELADGGRRLTVAPSAGGVALSSTVVNGVAETVPAVDDAGILLVPALTADGSTVVVAVGAAADGVHVERVAAGLGGSLAQVAFTNTPILFGGPLLRGSAATAVLAEALDVGRVAVAAQLAGCAAAVLEKTLAYVGQRKQFERTIGSFQTVQHRCVDIHIGVMLATASVGHAARVAVAKPAELPMAAAAAKARAGDVALHACRTAVQLHGAMGFTEEVDIGLHLRSALHLSTWLGTPSQSRRCFLAEWRNRGTIHA